MKKYVISILNDGHWLITLLAIFCLYLFNVFLTWFYVTTYNTLCLNLMCVGAILVVCILFEFKYHLIVKNINTIEGYDYKIYDCINNKDSVRILLAIMVVVIVLLNYELISIFYLITTLRGI